MSKLDKEERDILEAFDAGELKRVPDTEERKAQHQKYSEAMFKKRYPYQYTAFFERSAGASAQSSGRRYPLPDIGCQHPT